MKESLSNKQVYEICVAMCLLNPKFLEPLLSGGLEKRYSLNQNVFLNDLKNILLDPKTKIKLGKETPFNIETEEDQMGKMAKCLQSTDFQPSKDWNWLKNAESIAIEILKDIKPAQVYWLPESPYNIAIVDEYGQQYRLYLGKKLEKNYSLEEVFSMLFFLEEDNSDLLEILMSRWHEQLNKLSENLKKYLYTFDYKNDMSWSEFHSKISDKYLGEDVPELKHRYKKLNLFSKDAILYSGLMEEWKNVKIDIFSDYVLSKIIPKLKSLNVEIRDNHYYNDNLTEICKTFLQSHLDVEHFSNIYSSNSGERMQIYDKKDLEKEIGFSWNKDSYFSLCFSLNNKKIELKFDFHNGEMLSMPFFK